MQNGIYGILKKTGIIRSKESLKLATEKRVLGFEEARILNDDLSLDGRVPENPDLPAARLAGLKELADAVSDPIVGELDALEAKAAELLGRIESRYGAALQLSIDQLKNAIPVEGLDLDQLKKLEGLKLGK